MRLLLFLLLFMVASFIFLPMYFAENEGKKSGTGCVFGDCKSGYGGYLWPSGERYFGQWKGAKPDGQGIMRWLDGRTYVGQWQAGQMTGRGAMYATDRLPKRGQWKNGDFVARQKLRFEPKDSLWGENELQKMLADRPKMQAYWPVAQTLKSWFVAKLGGEKVGEKISWQAAGDIDFQLPPNVAAVHRWPSPTHAPAIWLSPDLASEALWASLVFELFNIENAEGFEQINADVARGTCDEASYVRRFAELEHVAVLKTQQFYSKYWLPACKNAKMSSQAQVWFAYAAPDFETWIAGYKDKNSYPWQPYTLYYQQIVSNTTKKY
jgi:hypothetical protein